MAVAIPFMMYAAAGLAAVSAIKQGQAASAAASFNTITNIQNATMARSEALLQAQQRQRETVLRIGAARAAAGASGGTGEGSALDIIGDIAAQGELERQFEIYKGEATARGYKNTATLDSAQGKQAMDAGLMGAGSSLLGGAVTANRTQGQLVRTR